DRIPAFRRELERGTRQHAWFGSIRIAIVVAGLVVLWWTGPAGMAWLLVLPSRRSPVRRRPRPLRPRQPLRAARDDADARRGGDAGAMAARAGAARRGAGAP